MNRFAQTPQLALASRCRGQRASHCEVERPHGTQGSTGPWQKHLVHAAKVERAYGMD